MDYYSQISFDFTVSYYTNRFFTRTIIKYRLENGKTNAKSGSGQKHRQMEDTKIAEDQKGGQ